MSVEKPRFELVLTVPPVSADEEAAILAWMDANWPWIVAAARRLPA